MSAHGVTQEACFDLSQLTQAGGGCRLLAKARIDRTGFGVSTARGFIDRFVDIELDIAALA